MSAWAEPDVTVVGGGMAGSEAAWQLAERGLRVALVEQKPQAMSPAHQTPLLGELVCSNSLRSDDIGAPAGLLKSELRRAGSMVIGCADRHRVPAGGALAVERFGFGRAITTRLALHPNVRIERRMLDELPNGPVIVATGPLTGGPLGEIIRRELGGDRMYFYDAIAPIVAADSIDMDRAFRASRWNKDTLEAAGDGGGDPALRAGGAASSDQRSGGGDLPGGAASSDQRSGGGDLSGGAASSEQCSGGGDLPGGAASSEQCSGGGDLLGGAAGDYVNCPLDRDEYVAFVDAVRAGRKVSPHDFEEPRYFESCLPIEVMADRGLDVLRFGPMRPVGLTDPRTGRWPHAVVQLRPENRYLTAYNLVGFQTRLAYPEQQRIFAMIPALAGAEFLRYGSIHRNTYVDAPRLLGPELELRSRPSLRFAGLLTGVEGYIESCAMGLLVAWFVAAQLRGRALEAPPPTTMLGGLHQHVVAPREGKYRYVPTNVNFGLLPPIDVERVRGTNRKDEKKRRLVERAVADLDAWLVRTGGRPSTAPSGW